MKRQDRFRGNITTIYIFDKGATYPEYILKTLTIP